MKKVFILFLAFLCTAIIFADDWLSDTPVSQDVITIQDTDGRTISLEIVEVSKSDGRALVRDARIRFSEGVTVVSPSGESAGIHFHGFSLDEKGHVLFSKLPEGGLISEDSYYIDSPFPDYRFFISRSKLTETGLLVSGSLVNAGGEENGLEFADLPLYADGPGTSFRIRLTDPEVKQVTVAGFPVRYSGRFLIPRGIVYDDAEMDLSVLDPGLTRGISGLVLSVDDPARIIQGTPEDSSFPLRIEGYGDAGDPGICRVKGIALNETSLVIERLEVPVPPEISPEPMEFQGLPVRGDGSLGESEEREENLRITLSGFPVECSKLSFRGNRLVLKNPVITMPPNSYPSAWNLESIETDLSRYTVTPQRGMRQTFQVNRRTFLLESPALTDQGLSCVASTGMPSRLSRSSVRLPRFLLKADGTWEGHDSGTQSSDAVPIMLGGWIANGFSVSFDGDHIKVGTAIIDFPRRMSDGSMEFHDLVFSSGGELVSSGGCDIRGELKAVNGFTVLPGGAGVTGNGIMLSGDILLPFGAEGERQYVHLDDSILFTSNGFISAETEPGSEYVFSYAGIEMHASNLSFARNGLAVGTTTAMLSECRLVIKDALFYPDGSVSSGGETEDVSDILLMKGFSAAIDDCSLSDNGIEADVGIVLPSKFGGVELNFREAVLLGENGELTMISDETIPRASFSLAGPVDVEFKYIAWDGESLKIGESIIEFPESLDSARIRIGRSTLYGETGYDREAFSVDPFSIRGFTFYPAYIDFCDDCLRISGQVKIPEDYQDTALAGKTCLLEEFTYYYGDRTVLSVNIGGRSCGIDSF